MVIGVRDAHGEFWQGVALLSQGGSRGSTRYIVLIYIVRLSVREYLFRSLRSGEPLVSPSSPSFVHVGGHET